MTILTKCYSVQNFKSQIWVKNKRQIVVCIYISASFSMPPFQFPLFSPFKSGRFLNFISLLILFLCSEECFFPKKLLLGFLVLFLKAIFNNLLNFFLCFCVNFFPFFASLIFFLVSCECGTPLLTGISPFLNQLALEPIILFFICSFVCFLPLLIVCPFLNDIICGFL